MTCTMAYLDGKAERLKIAKKNFLWNILYVSWVSLYIEQGTSENKMKKYVLCKHMKNKPCFPLALEPRYNQ